MVEYSAAFKEGVAFAKAENAALAGMAEFPALSFKLQFDPEFEKGYDFYYDNLDEEANHGS